MKSCKPNSAPSSGSALSGFTILELAIVLVIMGLVYTIGAPVMLGITDTANKVKISRTMADAQSALINFSSTNYRLPCPADPDTTPGTSGYGMEDCTLDAGMIPHVTLVLDQASLDTAMRPIRYIVYRVADATEVDGTQPNDADLAVAVNRLDNLEDVNQINIWDLCQALENSDPAYGTGEASISTLPFSTSANGCQGAGSFTNQAFVLASAGNRDSSRPADGLDFDGINVAEGSCFASPEQSWDIVYDDVVAATSFTTIMGLLCQ
ncbi:MAG: type II secretion system protein [Magnetococcales bacterium]|nr:type II secretion system protein [Magnetococcales bacterium]